MSKIPQIKNENSKKSETVLVSSGETKKNGLSPILAQIEVTPLMKGLGVVVVVVAAYAFGAVSYTSRKYIGGFRPQMTSREAALILGVRGSTSIDKVTEAHRRLMVANHPDMGGSHYLASKINEAKDKLIKKPKNTDSVFSYKLIVKEEYSQ